MVPTNDTPPPPHADVLVVGTICNLGSAHRKWCAGV